MTEPDRPRTPAAAPRLWLRRADQGAAALLTAGSLLVIAVYWFAQGGQRGGLIEIDRANRQSVQFVVDVNQAQWPELANIPGVGEELARRVVEDRTTRGPYRTVRDLRRVRGIGAITLERLKPYLAPLPDDASVAGD